MRKKHLTMLCAGFLLASTAAITSCGDDEDDLKPGTEQPDAQLGYKYVQPCLQWNATRSEVATYMATIPGWYLAEGSNPKVEIWMLDKPVTEITYQYGNPFGVTGLWSVSVMYYGYDLSDLKGKIEAAHNCTLEPKGTAGYETEVRINDRRTSIRLDVYEDKVGGLGKYMTVRYQLAY